MQTSKTSSTRTDLKFITEYLKIFTPRFYLVGGSVRDLFLGLDIYDYDIEIYDLSVREFDLLMKELGANGVGKSFFVYKYENFDLALARKENKTSSGHKGFEVALCNDEKEAAKRRDFTINSVMINLLTWEVLDFFGGREDIARQVLRHIDEKSFKEDSLRVLRAVHFVARFDLSIAPETLDLMKSMDISDLSLDRINAELYKFFKSRNLYLGFCAIESLNLEQKLFHFSCTEPQRREAFKDLLKAARELIWDEGLFLYLYLNFFKLDKRAFFAKTRLKKELFHKADQAFFEDEPSDFDLLCVALKSPLKYWFGLFSKQRVQRAKDLGVYEHKFNANIDVAALQKQGLSGKALGERIKALEIEEIKNFLKAKSCKHSS